jgi:3-isopropylmalate/(R)-2-methylmalate dehydratase small subunit
MQEIINGKAYVLGDNTDTDQIIAAEWLKLSTTEPGERKYYGAYALRTVPEGKRGLPMGDVPFVREGEFRSDFSIIVGGKNFGSGSSREHAPLALAEAGVQCVIAEFYARIFFRNSVNGGYLVPFESEIRLVDKIHTGDDLEVNLKTHVITNRTRKETYVLKPLGDVLPIIEAGGVFNYAQQAGMLK